jgi:hypothetical protein
MARAELYREFARKCLELAYKVAPESRRVLFEMVRIWHQWAQHQEQGAAGREPGGRALPKGRCNYAQGSSIFRIEDEPFTAVVAAFARRTDPSRRLCHKPRSRA